MNTTRPKVSREQVEAIAERLGAPRWSVLKWRQRGIPGDWGLRIVDASDGTITAADMITFSEPGIASEVIS